MLFFSALLPLELLIWGQALDTELGKNYLSRRLQLSLFCDLPQEYYLIGAVLALIAILLAGLELGKGSHRRDILLFCGFPFYMFSLFLLFRCPCAAAIGTGLIVLAAWAVWFAYPAEDRPPFPLPNDWTVRADGVHRLTAGIFLLGLLFAGMLIFQEGYLLWLTFQWTPLLVIVPLAGLFLPTAGQLREYLTGGVYALALAGLIYAIGQLFPDISDRTVWGIASTYIFLELLVSQMIRPMLPKVKNNSLIILVLSSLMTVWIMPPICSPWIISLSTYLLYLVIDNRMAIRKKLLFTARLRQTKVHFLAQEECAALVWAAGGLLGSWLAGPKLIPQILIVLGVVLLAGLVRTHLLSDMHSEHLIPERFTYTLEISVLLLTVLFLCSWPNSSCATETTSRGMVMIQLSIYAAVTSVMQVIWNIGGLIGHYTSERPSLQLFHILCQSGIGVLLILLFFIQAPAAVLLGCFCILTGIVKLAENSFLKKQNRNRELTADWVLIVIGQFVFVSSAETVLPTPRWSIGAPICAILFCTALYVYLIFDFRNRTQRNHEL
jgi:hypothetical protein